MLDLAPDSVVSKVLDALPLPDRVRLGAACKCLRRQVGDYNRARPDRSCMLVQRGSCDLAMDMIRRLAKAPRGAKRAAMANRLGEQWNRTGVYVCCTDNTNHIRVHATHVHAEWLG